LAGKTTRPEQALRRKYLLQARDAHLIFWGRAFHYHAARVPLLFLSLYTLRYHLLDKNELHFPESTSDHHLLSSNRCASAQICESPHQPETMAMPAKEYPSDARIIAPQSRYNLPQLIRHRSQNSEDTSDIACPTPHSARFIICFFSSSMGTMNCLTENRGLARNNQQEHSGNPHLPRHHVGISVQDSS
jgi:hypothetical protein